MTEPRRQVHHTSPGVCNWLVWSVTSRWNVHLLEIDADKDRILGCFWLQYSAAHSASQFVPLFHVPFVQLIGTTFGMFHFLREKPGGVVRSRITRLATSLTWW
jgi:hypothetical protein